ncbi:MAG: hypothetical protein ABIP71_06040, partial [Verrucomicrobiota bacterium]
MVSGKILLQLTSPDAWRWGNRRCVATRTEYGTRFYKHTSGAARGTRMTTVPAILSCQVCL